jgi:hypothetical protein
MEEWPELSIPIAKKKLLSKGSDSENLTPIRTYDVRFGTHGYRYTLQLVSVTEPSGGKQHYLLAIQQRMQFSPTVAPLGDPVCKISEQLGSKRHKCRLLVDTLKRHRVSLHHLESIIIEKTKGWNRETLPPRVRSPRSQAPSGEPKKIHA